jgi:serine/threonine-protein kinase RsbW
MPPRPGRPRKGAAPPADGGPVLALEVPSDTAFLGLVGDLARRVAEAAGLAASAPEGVALAVVEAATNAIEHAYGNSPRGRIALRFRETPQALEIEVADRGRAVDLPEGDLGRHASEKRTGGLGVHLMRKAIDSVSFASSGGENCCRLVKHKASAPAARRDSGGSRGA